MNRRDWFKLSAVAPAAASMPARTAPASSTAIQFNIRRLQLKHTWTTVMSSSEYRDTFYVEITRDGLTGTGEGAPIVRYKESAGTAQAALSAIRPWLAEQDPAQYRRILQEVNEKVPGEYAGKAALDIALLDWNAQRLGVPLYRMFGLDGAATPVTTFSIGIDTPEMTRQKVEEAADFPVLKVKTGLGKDEATIQAIRAVTDKPLRADANEGYKTREEAVERINFLGAHGVEFIEQPMVASNLEDMNWIRARVHIPIFADEACLRLTDVPKLANYFDGINVKVDKAGGLLEAMRMIELARAYKLKVMLGCMVSSSAAVTAAAHLSPLVDYADLDGNLLIANDPYEGVTVRHGKLILPNRPGTGLRRRA